MPVTAIVSDLTAQLLLVSPKPGKSTASPSLKGTGLSSWLLPASGDIIKFDTARCAAQSGLLCRRLGTHALHKNRNRSDDACSGGSCTMKNQTRLMRKRRHKGTVFNVHDANAGADGGLEKISRDVGPRPVHFPDRWCTRVPPSNDAASISHPADAKVPVSH